MSAFLLEVGTEELPADFVASAINQWQTGISQSLQEHFLTPETISVYATPRRLAVLVMGLPKQQPDREEEIKGPPAKAAFKDGKPTKAAEGFAKKQGVDLAELSIRDTKKGEFVFAQRKTSGRAATEIIPELIPQWIASLEGRRFMRWGDGDLRFPRPIRWLVALMDGEVLPVSLVSGSMSVTSDRISRGHRILHPEAVSIPQATDYIECLRSAAVEVDPAQRESTIKQQVEAAAQELGGSAEVYPELLAEVVNLVEYPSAVIGKFDEDFLQLPTEVIKTVMVTHQRYFPVQSLSDSEQLLANFITISNGDPKKSAIISAGNGRVIRARLADAQFFYKADLSEPLESYVASLEKVTFQEELGSMADKVTRLSNIAEKIAEQLNLKAKEKEQIQRTALLCKADLETQMVYEFPELQGIIGKKYALASGEESEVAQGIEEHYLPRGAEDDLPQSLTGQIVGLADRLDTLISIFGLGMLPSGSSDPFALRRAANGIINIIWFANLELDLVSLLEESSAAFITLFPEQKSPFELLQDFFLQRLRNLLQEEKGIDYDLVNAVLGEQDQEYGQRALGDILDLRDRAVFLQNIRDDRTLDTIYETVNRSTRLAAKGNLDTQELEPSTVVNPELFEKASEQAFYDALFQLASKSKISKQERNYQLLVTQLAEIAPTVSNFFDGDDSVLVIAEDPEIKQNRLNLLGLLRNHARILADFGAIVKS